MGKAIKESQGQREQCPVPRFSSLFLVGAIEAFGQYSWGTWCGFWDGSVQGQELDSTILVSLFQFYLFCDSVICPTNHLFTQCVKMFCEFIAHKDVLHHPAWVTQVNWAGKKPDFTAKGSRATESTLAGLSAALLSSGWDDLSMVTWCVAAEGWYLLEQLPLFLPRTST